jgi:4-hydroxybenzoate polyprenyltransferase
MLPRGDIIKRAIYPILGTTLIVLGIISNMFLPGFFESIHGLTIMVTLILTGVLCLRYAIYHEWNYSWDHIFYFGVFVIWIWIVLQPVLNLEQLGNFFMVTPAVDLIWPAIMMAATMGILMVTNIIRIQPKNKPNGLLDASELPPILDKVGSMGRVVKFMRIDQWVGAFLISIWIYVILGVPIVQFSTVISLIALVFLFSFAFAINQLSDLDTDIKNPDKKQLTVASGDMSKKVARIITLTLAAGGILLAIAISYDFLVLSVGFLLVNIFYSVPPFRFKAKRFLDLIMIGLGLGVFPVLLPWVVGYQLTSSLLPLILGVMLFNVSAHCFQMLGDIDADKRAGLKTTAVFFGKEWTLRLGVIFFSVGLLLLMYFGIFSTTITSGWFKARTIFLFLLLGLLGAPALQTLTSREKKRLHYRALDKQTRRIVYMWIAFIIIHSLVSGPFPFGVMPFMP